MILCKENKFVAWMKMTVAYCCCLFLLFSTTPTLSLLLVVSPPGVVLRLRQRRPERTFINSLQIQDHPDTTLLGRRRQPRILRLSLSSRMGEDPDDWGDDEGNDRNPVPHHSSHPEYYLFESPMSLFYEERRPMRPSTPPSTTTTTEHSSTFTRIQKKRTKLVRVDAVPDVIRIEPPHPQFPSTVDALSEQAVQAILQACRSEPTARIGLDIQGLHHLDTATSSSSMRQQRQRHTSESAALRQLALHLAGKLSSSCSSCSSLSRGASKRGTGSQEHELYRTDSPKSNTRIPISIYWNTVKQALVASQELLFLKRIEKHHQRHSSAGNNPHDHSIYDRIQIRCLVGDHPMIPPDMLLPKQNDAFTTSRRQRQQPKTNKPQKQGDHALRGLILVVQPTDYNDNNEYEPPGPAVNVWTALQELMASAAVEGLPVVCLSPKSWYPPTPWVLRDFCASPVLSWTLHPASKQQQPAVAVWRGTPPENDDDAAADRWHVFATSPIRANGTTTTNGNSFSYLASCREAPTAQRLRHLWSEYRIS